MELVILQFFFSVDGSSGVIQQLGQSLLWLHPLLVFLPMEERKKGGFFSNLSFGQ